MSWGTKDSGTPADSATGVTAAGIVCNRRLFIILSPLALSDVPTIRGVGLNYIKHSKTEINQPAANFRELITAVQQAKRTPPTFPFMFFKPQTTILDHGDNMVIPKIAQDDQADYEGELTIVIGKDAKDVSQENALDYVAVYTVGNDISSRKLQRDPEHAGRIPQWGFSKGFDTYAPIGPCLLASSLVDDPKNLHLTTVVDGEVRQDESVDDLLFECRYLISYLSQGTTLQKGSMIMTGTSGVGGDMKPPRWLQLGTQMEVRISKIGTLRNGVVFAE
ncbi:unnamed protein product [Penicillium nalgiovense]|uniref:Fumarylacetoacetase-like C-terminal domain-containing protein n=1 Tax=Penicillium nalgiovense TaxID=60175 RepID=A0A9W4HXE8_PENNA|nr:unnamed protein product [Penicillium nalgiovense]CAG8049829.1 unnamed protein product [Penicillium nalgiovense]CAG8072568.1 unnamed protein product [Penicillium nalgiovense]CAG8102520.1 unnamed protein product [Penicillium nalgiovense]CAG8124594.1 unnamed protein product [Penicillium nalgiovense]